METRDVILETPHGLHLRTASAVVSVVKQHDAQVTLSCQGCRHADGCSILQLLLLNATTGSPIHIEVNGPDEQRVADRLCSLFSEGGGI